MAYRRPAHSLLPRVATVLIIGSLLTATNFVAAHAGPALGPAAAVPTYGGSYSDLLPAVPPCLDVQKTGSNLIGGYYLDSLLSIDKKGKYVGDLATGYKIANKGLKITFTLRKGVKFSNGDPFNAHAVKYTFDRALDPATKSPVTAGNLATVTATKVISTYVVELDLKAPYRPLLTDLSNSYTGILDPKAPPTCDSVIGTGPYKIQSIEPGLTGVTVVANKYHTWAPRWVQNKKGVPYVTKVVFKTFASDATAISEFLTGGIDMGGIPGTQLSRLQGNKSIAIHRIPTQGESFVEFNTAHPPFNSAAARRAFGELIDRSAIVSAAYAGQGKPNYTAIAPAIPDYDSKANTLAPHLNASAAAAYFQSHHLTGPYTLLTLSVPDLTTTAEILQGAAQQAGVKLNIVSKALPDYFPLAGGGDFDVLLLEYQYPDPDVLYLLLHSSQGGGKGLNFSNYTSAALDNDLVKGRETLNGKKAASYYDKAQELVARQSIFLGTVVPTSLLGVRTTIHGLHFNKDFETAIQDLYIKTK